MIKKLLLFLLIFLFVSPIFSQIKIAGLHNRGGLYYEVNSQIPYDGEETRGKYDLDLGESLYTYHKIENGVMLILKKYYHDIYMEGLGNVDVYILEEYRYPNNNMKKRIVYDPNLSRQMVKEENFNRDGLPHGKSTSYYVSNGQIKKQELYYNGELLSSISYKLDGTIIESIEHSQEPGKSIEHSQEPLDLDELVIKDGLFYSKDNNQQPYSGKVFRNFSSGNIRSEGNMKNGQLHGINLEYWENGQVQFETTYRDGKKSGPETWYYENGTLLLESTYKDGKENGLFKMYHENGQLKGEVIFKDGKETGVFKQFDKNGKRIR